MALHVSDLKLAAGVRALLDPKRHRLRRRPQGEKVEAEAAPVEGAVPAEVPPPPRVRRRREGAKGAAPPRRRRRCSAKKEGEKKGK